MKHLKIPAILIFLLVAISAWAQPSPLPPVNGGGTGATETGYFNIVVDPAVYTGAGDKEGDDDIRFLALRTAYGLVNGIEWYRKSTDKNIVIDEKLYAVNKTMKLDEMTELEGMYRYSYSYDYSSGDVDDRKVGKVIDVTGTSDAENMAQAWEAARKAAFTDAINEALKREYIDNQKAVPPEIQGLISTYEVVYDDYDYTDNIYKFQINAWVTFGPRQGLM